MYSQLLSQPPIGVYALHVFSSRSCFPSNRQRNQTRNDSSSARSGYQSQVQLRSCSSLCLLFESYLLFQLKTRQRPPLQYWFSCYGPVNVVSFLINFFCLTIFIHISSFCCCKSSKSRSLLAPHILVSYPFSRHYPPSLGGPGREISFKTSR